MPHIGTLALAVSAAWASPLALGRLVPAVPCKSPDQVHAAFTPDATYVGNQTPHRLVPESLRAPGFDIVGYFTTRHRWFTFVHLPDPHLRQLHWRFVSNAHHHGSLPQQLGVVWNPPLEADSEGPDQSHLTVHHLLHDCCVPKSSVHC